MTITKVAVKDARFRVFLLIKNYELYQIELFISI